MPLQTKAVMDAYGWHNVAWVLYPSFAVIIDDIYNPIFLSVFGGIIGEINIESIFCLISSVDRGRPPLSWLSTLLFDFDAFPDSLFRFFLCLYRKSHNIYPESCFPFLNVNFML